jgi:hypothetical protein
MLRVCDFFECARFQGGSQESLTAKTMPAPRLTIGSTANKLVGMIAANLKELLAVATAVKIHQAAPEVNGIRSF